MTAENINDYAITDLVLPLLGPQTNLPQGTWLAESLADELKAINLTKDDFMHSAKAQNAKAAWRRMLVIPEVVDHEIMAHSNPKDELQSPFYTLGDALKVPEGELRSLRVVLRLPKSSYATMAIREMLHVPSEFEIQRQLNHQYEERYAQSS